MSIPTVTRILTISAVMLLLGVVNANAAMPNDAASGGQAATPTVSKDAPTIVLARRDGPMGLHGRRFGGAPRVLQGRHFDGPRRIHRRDGIRRHRFYGSPRRFIRSRVYVPSIILAPRIYSSSRCDYWHRRCVVNWGRGNSNYYGCMRYHNCD